jgi:hypothetical protein
MNKQPSRAEIIAALNDPNPNPLADSIADAIAKYSRAFADEATRRGGLKHIRLPAPTTEVEAVAFELFVEQIKAEIPSASIKIKGDS